jgi:phosphoribosylamine--glycine ligase
LKVLVIGSGGREHALVWKLAQSPQVDKLYCAPGNPGIAQLAELVDLDMLDVPGLVAFAEQQAIDLVIPGPEAPLVAGLANRLAKLGINCFGPMAEGARLEGSKVFAKTVMAEAGIPTADFEVFSDADEALAYLEKKGAPIVVKADGLAAGKGALVAQTLSAARKAVELIMVEKAFGLAGDQVVIEEYMTGPECSIKAFCDGADIIPMAPSQDYKRAFDCDAGLNTGGMGAYSPIPLLSDELFQQICREVLEPLMRAMADRGLPYKGVIYAGLMLTPTGPRVLEFNCRFGDPETQVILPRLGSDLVDLCLAGAEGRLAEIKPCWSPLKAVSVVMASGGYPGRFAKGKLITGIDEAEQLEGVTVFQAGTKLDEEGRLVTAGGRVLNVTALAPTFTEARTRAYEGVARIHFDDVHYRKDIALRAVERG